MARIDTLPTYSGPASMPPAAWIGDYLDREHLIAGGARLDPAQFTDSEAVAATLTANAAQGATSLTVAALAGPIPSGTLLDFGGAKFARTSADAAKAATTIAVAATPTAMVTGDKATYSPRGALKNVPSGTLLGRTYTERDANAGFGPAADTDDEVFLLAFDVTDAATDPDCTLYRPGSIVKENFLATFAGLSTALKAKVRSTYLCVRGAN
jgi:hypothetical protein